MAMAEPKLPKGASAHPCFAVLPFKSVGIASSQLPAALAAPLVALAVRQQTRGRMVSIQVSCPKTRVQASILQVACATGHSLH